MELHALGTPAQVWRRWVLLAAGHAATQRPGYEIRRSDGCALLDDGTAWLRMRRLVGNRAVIWGNHPDLAVDERFLDTLLDEAPDWSYEVDSAYAARQVGFLGWFAHGSWSSVPSPVPAPVAALLSPMGSDEVVSSWWRAAWPEAPAGHLAAAFDEPDATSLAAVVGGAAAARAGRQLGLGRSWSTRQLSDAATVHLRSQIHAQMRAGGEIADRGHPTRPPLLRQWARVSSSARSFTHAVCGLGSAATPAAAPAPGNRGLSEAQARTLGNVVMELRMTETDESSGAWLFARITGSGRSVTMERAFDSWPSWYDAGTGPTMTALHAEMTQRSPRWRPSWAALLPVDRY